MIWDHGNDLSLVVIQSQAGYVSPALLTPLGAGAGTVSVVQDGTGVAISASSPTALMLPYGYANVRLEAEFHCSGFTGSTAFLGGLFARGAMGSNGLTGYGVMLRLGTDGTGAERAGELRCFTDNSGYSTNAIGSDLTSLPSTATTDTIRAVAEFYCEDLEDPNSPTAYRAKMFVANDLALGGPVPDWQAEGASILQNYGGTDYHWQDAGCGFVITLTGATCHLHYLTATPIEGIS